MSNEGPTAEEESDGPADYPRIALEVFERFLAQIHEAFRPVIFFMQVAKSVAYSPSGTAEQQDALARLAVAIHEELMWLAINLPQQALGINRHQLQDMLDAWRHEVYRQMPYEQYLDSPWWHFKRLDTIRRDGGACRVCASTKYLNVHHRTYENLGREKPEDLVTLCCECHGLFHANGKLQTPKAAEGVDIGPF